MSTKKFAPKSHVRVTSDYPEASLHGRAGILVDYSDDRKPRAIVVFLDAAGEFEDTRIMFDNELVAA